ncbi:MAG: CHC2 zinc finger domain-containing protein [Vicinamibacterales bacterium]
MTARCGGAHSSRRNSSGSDFDVIRARVSLLDVLARLGISDKLRRSGNNLVGACPVCRIGRRSFVVDPEANRWSCFADCKSGGGVLELVSALERVSIIEAARIITAWFALASPSPWRPVMSKPTHKVLTAVERTDGNNTAKAFYTRIGAGWPIKNGTGIAVTLDALPVNGRLIILEIGEDDQDESRPRS